MRECGLTHGGFYTHFPSKDVLISEACIAALDEAVDQWQDLARQMSDDKLWAKFLKTYLAGDLVSAGNNPACPAAILGADVARRQDIVQTTYIDRLKGMIDVMTDESGGSRSHAILSFAALIGATSLAAQVGQDKALAKEILSSTRDELLKCRPPTRAG
jgi:TetR/AcrR family transcriptional repressor of nem operon